MPRPVDVEWAKRMNRNHKGEYLTEAVVEKYRKIAEKLPNTNGQIIGERRALCLRLMDEYGLDEIEATNILNGKYGSDYINKYYRIANEIPIEHKSRKNYDGEEDEIDEF